MNLVALPAFSDNYIWMLHDGREALVVDPGDAAPVRDALQTLGLSLTGILVTHHHPDHVGGLDDLRQLLSGPVFGPAREAIPQPTTPLRGGDRAAWNGLLFEILDVPGHTSGHIAFYVSAPDRQAPLLFCGDTLFSGGCGRLFEGTADQMYRSLRALGGLPGATRVCCAHEYTLSNLRFAQSVDPDNPDLHHYALACAARRERGEPTLPSTLAIELQINPFLRCDQPALIAAAQAHGASGNDPVQVFSHLREWKNQFR